MRMVFNLLIVFILLSCQSFPELPECVGATCGGEIGEDIAVADSIEVSKPGLEISLEATGEVLPDLIAPLDVLELPEVEEVLPEAAEDIIEVEPDLAGDIVEEVEEVKAVETVETVGYDQQEVDEIGPVEVTQYPGEDYKEQVGEVGFDMIHIKTGCYQMGCVPLDNKCIAHEKPAHSVCVSSFHMSKTEVTAGLFQQCVDAGGCSGYYHHTYQDNEGCNLGAPGRQEHPMNCIEWQGTVEFALWLSGVTGRIYRLPYEAEWEYAGKNLGQELMFPWGNFDYWGYEEGICLYVNCGEESLTSAVCSKTAGNTDQGLCDMSGNVMEWCMDWYDAEYYIPSLQDDPQGPESGSYRVLRGGAWNNFWHEQRLSTRFYNKPSYWNSVRGFRLVHAQQ